MCTKKIKSTFLFHGVEAKCLRVERALTGWLREVHLGDVYCRKRTPETKVRITLNKFLGGVYFQYLNSLSNTADVFRRNNNKSGIVNFLASVNLVETAKSCEDHKRNQSESIKTGVQLANVSEKYFYEIFVKF